MRIAVLIGGYCLVLAAAIAAMGSARDWALVEFDTAASREQWSDFRHHVQQEIEEGKGPVARTTPKSAEPPTFVLLRDHFYVLSAFVLLVSTLLYWVTAWMVLGAMRTSRSYADSES
ncbi:MAG: hypothetical protein ACIALR_04790 [Blastopirellula sp. JB062]